MPRLVLSLLGSFRAILDGRPITAFQSDKARALLAYLAVESERPHSREKLAGLLWPNSSEAAARASLSEALSSLRQALGDRAAQAPVLLASRQSVQFNCEADVLVDVVAFERQTRGERSESMADGGDSAYEVAISNLQSAISLYRGRFLEGFSLPGCAEFEEWLLLEQEHLHRLATQTLARLAATYESQGEFQHALSFAWRRLELDPWRESAHRLAMRLLARCGERDAALAQYQTCCRLLADELGAEPSQETVRLYEQIRDGQLPTLASPSLTLPSPSGRGEEPALPGFLTGRTPQGTRPIFVAREKELAWLDGLLEQALSGRGQAAFVAGGPGRGKTVLLQEFARRAMDAHPDLLVALGTCNAYSGLGDPYLPFRGVLAMLTGDAEASWVSGILSTEQARRLWDSLPDVAPVLARWGSGLVGTLLRGRELLARAQATAAGTPTPHPSLSHWEREDDWLAPLEQLVDSQASRQGGLEQSHLFEQLANVLLNLSAQHPLLLVLDDLQWADQASIGLLFHLGRRIEGGRILLAGAVRPHELAVGRDGERHPLEPVLAEFRSRFGDAWLDLAAADETEGRLFVDRYLDTAPNALGEGFREALFGRTGGHALFTVELLRAMQQRGDLVQDGAGRWVEGERLQWDVLPARAEAAIAERIDRLPEDLREILAVASVEGEEFTAQMVAEVQGTDELQTLRMLRQQLAARHRLVREQRQIHAHGHSLSRYRFSHFLVQQHLYQGLGEGERRLLHHRVGEALEKLYEGRLEEVCVELAHHFAGDPEHERRYARLAGERAAARFANEEALRYLSRALELSPDDENRDRYEMLLAREEVYARLGKRGSQRQDLDALADLGNGLGAEEQVEASLRKACYFLDIHEFPAAVAAAQAGMRLFEEAHPRAQSGAEARTRYWLGAAYLFQDWYADAAPQLEAALQLARQVGDRRIEAQALGSQGVMQMWLGTDAAAELLFRESMALAHEIGDMRLEARTARDLSEALCHLGRHAEATNLAEASRVLFEQTGDRAGVSRALIALGMVAQSRGDWEAAARAYRDVATRSEDGRLRVSIGLQCLGQLAVVRGELDEARGCWEQVKAIGDELDQQGLVAMAVFWLGTVAGQQGRISEARAYFEQANALNEKTGDWQSLACGQARLGYLMARQGQLQAGWAQMLRALRFSLSGDHPAQLKESLGCIGKAGVQAGHLQRGAELLGLGLALGPKWADLGPWSKPELDLLRAALGDEWLEAALARGAALDSGQVVAEILACETPEAYWGAETEGLAAGGIHPHSTTGYSICESVEE